MPRVTLPLPNKCKVEEDSMQHFNLSFIGWWHNCKTLFYWLIAIRYRYICSRKSYFSQLTLFHFRCALAKWSILCGEQTSRVPSISFISFIINCPSIDNDSFKVRLIFNPLSYLHTLIHELTVPSLSLLKRYTAISRFLVSKPIVYDDHSPLVLRMTVQRSRSMSKLVWSGRGSIGKRKLLTHAYRRFQVEPWLRSISLFSWCIICGQRIDFR
jgi:hypothetical protein